MPAPIYVNPHGDEQTGIVFLTRQDWSQVGKYIYTSQQYMRAAGPCLQSHESKSDVPVGTGVSGKTQRNP